MSELEAPRQRLWRFSLEMLPHVRREHINFKTIVLGRELIKFSFSSSMVEICGEKRIQLQKVKFSSELDLTRVSLEMIPRIVDDSDDSLAQYFVDRLDTPDIRELIVAS